MFYSQIAAIEGQNFIKHGIKKNLSEQELVDCAGYYKNRGCDGGFQKFAFAYVRDHGISELTDYPYQGIGGSCKSHSNSANIELTEYKEIAPSEEQLKQAVGKIRLIFQNQFTIGLITILCSNCWSNFCNYRC